MKLNVISTKFTLRHELKLGDFPRRLQFSQWFLNQCHNNRFLFNFVIGDEATFSLNGRVNSHNVRRYAPKGQHPSFNYDVNSARQKVTVWAGMCGNGSLLGPFFFEGNVNGRIYLTMFNNYMLPALLRAYGLVNEQQMNEIWWAQDGAQEMLEQY